MPCPQRRIRLSGSAASTRRDPPTRADHPGELVEEAGQLHEVAQREAAGGAVGGAVGQGEGQDVAVDQGCLGAGGDEHPHRQVDTDRSETGLRRLPTEVAGAAGEVEDPANRREGRARRAPCGASGRRARRS